MNRQKVELSPSLQRAGRTVYNAGRTVYNAGRTVYNAAKTAVNNYRAQAKRAAKQRHYEDVRYGEENKNARDNFSKPLDNKYTERWKESRR